MMCDTPSNVRIAFDETRARVAELEMALALEKQAHEEASQVVTELLAGDTDREGGDGG
jgi:hypothetical protein